MPFDDNAINNSIPTPTPAPTLDPANATGDSPTSASQSQPPSTQPGPQSAQPGNSNQNSSQIVSNQPPADPNANHPLVVRAGVTNAVARALAGNPTRTVIDADGNRRTEPVPLTKSHIAMALAMEAISGSLTGLTAGRGRGIGAAGAAAFQQSANQRLQAQQAQDQQAQEDANNRANALTRKAQAAELNSRILLSTAEAESRGAETLQKIADTNKQLISDYEDKNALMARGVTQQELLEGMKSGKYDSTSAIGPIDGYRLVGDGRVEATHAIVSDPSAKVTLTPEQFEDYAANHVPGFPKGVKILSTQVSGATIARANEQKSAFMLAQARHDEVAKALSESDDPKVKALAAKVPSIGSLLDDPKTSPGLITALQRYQKYVSHSDFSHGGDLYDSLRMMAAPSKPDGKGSFVPNGDQKYADQVANAFGGWDVLEKYHEAVKPLEIKNENDASDMLASSEPGSRSYKYAKRWLSANAQAKAATASAEARAKASVAATSARNEDGSWNQSSIPVALVEATMDPSQLSKRSGDYNQKLQDANAYSLQKYGKPFDIAQAQSDYKFANTPATQNTLRYLNSLTGSDNKGGNLGALVDLSSKISRTDFPSLNDAAAWAKLQTGNAQMASYYTAVTEVADQVAKILQGGGSGSGTSDAKLKQAAELFDKGFSKDQIAGVATTLRTLLANRKTELIGDNRYLKKQFGGSTPATALNTQSPQLTNLQVNPTTGQQIGWNGSSWVDAKSGKAIQ